MSELEAAAAAAATAASAAPEPEVIQVDDVADDLPDLPEDQDTFSREYVEELRSENAKARTRGRDIEAAFAGYKPAEKARFLELSKLVIENPEKALEEFQGVTNKLATQLGKTVTPVADEVVIPAAEAPAADGVLTAEQVTEMVTAQLEAEREVAARANQNQDIFQQAATLDPKYAEGSRALVDLLSVAQSNPEAGGTLEGAHAIIEAETQAIKDAAIEEYREGIRTGKKHPPRLPNGDPQAQKSTGPPTTIEEASARARERLDATYDG